MIKIIAREFLYLFIALIVAVGAGFLLVDFIKVEAAGLSFTADEKVLQMEVLIVGSAIGFVGFYLIRLMIWGIKRQRRPK